MKATAEFGNTSKALDEKGVDVSSSRDWTWANARSHCVTSVCATMFLATVASATSPCCANASTARLRYSAFNTNLHWSTAGAAACMAPSLRAAAEALAHAAAARIATWACSCRL